ncbi:hypothetical protein OG245_21395 [Streptomyces sp. NBC_01116]|uniref:hypothetical protein n=1 Tax=Streptomyces sp. NBC_01116 TaxID=2903752 RepID=UPI00324DBDBF
MGVPELLEAASLLVPEEIATENDITVNDVWGYLAHDEWEVALSLLEELGDGQRLPLGLWEALATAAEQMWLEKSAAWCHWRSYETRHGIIRADLTLRPGQVITMHEDRSVAATAVVLEVQQPPAVSTATPGSSGRP